jgi:8-oxo-dGTP pyrophosphatase MutT (NUDIX family)
VSVVSEPVHCACGFGLPEHHLHSVLCPVASGRRLSAVSLIIDDLDGPEILAVWNKRYRGWGLPGGMVEEGESPYEAMKRELEEEVGLLVGRAGLVHIGAHNTHVGSHARGGRPSLVHVYLVEPAGSPRQMEEGSPVGWKRVDEMLHQSPFSWFYAAFLSDAVAGVMAARQSLWTKP